MTRPRTTTSPTDALGASLADSKARLGNLETLAHRHDAALAPLDSPTFTGTPRYASLPNPYGWHTTNQPLGTEMVIGAFARNGAGFGGGANVWIDMGSVSVTIPVGAAVIEMVYGTSFFTTAGGGFLIGMYYTGTGGSTTMQWFTNESYSHKIVAGTMGLGVVPGVGTVGLRVYGQGITIQSDGNDSCYFTVHTV